MASPVTLSEAKLFLRIDEADTTEDTLIESLVIAATEWASAFTGVDYTSEYAEPSESVKTAIKLRVASVFENRNEEVTGSMVFRLNFTAESLLSPYKVKFS